MRPTVSQKGPIESIVGLIVWLGLSFAVATSGMAFQAGEWYQLLAKPEWTPPDWLFPPVWTALYIMMAVAAWLIWRQDRLSAVWAPLTAYIVQLALNALWSWIFFGEHLIGVGLIDIILLWVTIVVTIILFMRRHQVAGLLLVPYLLWVTYAAALNFEIWRIN